MHAYIMYIKVGALALVRALLNAEGCWGRGAAPSSRNAFNDTPLHAAAFKGHCDIIQSLIEAQVMAGISVKGGGYTGY